MFEEYIVAEGNAGVDAEKVIVDLVKGLTSVYVDGNEEPLNLYTENVIQHIADFDSNFEISTSNVRVDSTALGAITSSIEWKRSCAISANLICNGLISGSGKEFEVLHNKASNSFIEDLKFVEKLVSPTVGGRLDRWNPADMWLISNSGSELVTPVIREAKSKSLENNLEKAEALNQITLAFDKAFGSKDVIGISLKKVVLTKKSLKLYQEGDVEVGSATQILGNTNIIFSSESMFTGSMFKGGEFEAKNGRIHCKFSDSSSNGILRMKSKTDDRVSYELRGHSTFLGSSAKIKYLPTGSGSLYSYLVGDESGPIKDDTVKDQIRQLVQHCVSEYSGSIVDDDTVIVTSAKHYRIA